MLAELLGTEELRELLDPEALAALEAELQALDERRWARIGDAAARPAAPARRPDRGRSCAARCRRATCAAGRWWPTGGPSWSASPARSADRRRGRRPLPRRARRPAAARVARRLPGPGRPTPSGRSLGRWARTHGPFAAESRPRRFGLPVGRGRSPAGRPGRRRPLLRGEFRPGGSETASGATPRSCASCASARWPPCAGRSSRSTPACWPGFLPAWQGVAARGPAPGSGSAASTGSTRSSASSRAWPCRPACSSATCCRPGSPSYSPRLLDELPAAGEVMWVGAGPLGPRRRPGRALPSGPGRPAPASAGSTAERPAGPEHDHLRAVLDRRGRLLLPGAGRPARTTRASLDALWDLVWAGEVTNDSFAALRAFVGQGGRRRAPSKRSGRPRLGSLTVLGPPRRRDGGRWSMPSCRWAR